MRRPRSRCGVALLASGVLLALATSARGEPPLVAGTWLLRSATGHSFVDIQQDGGAVTFSYEGIALAGTITDDGLLRASGGAIATGLVQVDAGVSAAGHLMNAAVVLVSSPPGGGLQFVTPVFLGQRCECVDGNLADGDGCDSDCQVEPCWTCAGSPSECLPAEDGSACDGGPCTSGMVCSAGACDGGDRVASCIDLSGRWTIEARKVDFVGQVTVVDYERVIDQRGAFLVIRDEEGGGREYFGTIDAPTRSIAWNRLTAIDISGLCSPAEQAYRLPYSGSVAADSLSFTADGIEAQRVSRCPLPVDVHETAARADAPPGPCTGKPDGEPCSNGKRCVDGEHCSGGVCGGGEPVVCGGCEHCDADTGCRAAPSSGCATGTASLRFRSRPSPLFDSFEWRWEASPPNATIASLAPPEIDDYWFCLFDTSGTSPELSVRVAVAADECERPECWRRGDFGQRVVYRDARGSSDGALLLALRGGRRPRVRLRAGGSGLLGRPFGLPIDGSLPSEWTAEIRRSDGNCVGARSR